MDTACMVAGIFAFIAAGFALGSVFYAEKARKLAKEALKLLEEEDYV